MKTRREKRIGFYEAESLPIQTAARSQFG